MNTKSFYLGFVTMSSIINGVSATKRGAVQAVKAPAHSVQASAQATYEAVTSFFAGAKQAVMYHRGVCRAITYDKHG